MSCTQCNRFLTCSNCLSCLPLPDVTFFSPLPFSVAVNGVIQYSWNGTEYRRHCHYLTYNNDICVLWNDESRARSGKKEDVELGIRLLGKGGRNAMIAFTQVYYA